MGSEENRFMQQQGPPLPSRRKRWGRCLGGLSCFRKQKGGKRVVPSSRIPEANSLANQQNVQQAGGLNNPTTAVVPSLLAPPSSPASFSNSALPSTAQSPSNFLSANSPGGPSSAMYATGPYAHETQLVSPPVFSNFTTEPSTAPFTPPPELAHLTTPSSPDVPFAQFLSSVNLKATGKTSYIGANDLQATYSLYPGSPALRSPVLRASGDCLSSSCTERELPQLDSSIPSAEAKYPGPDSSTSTLCQDSNFFCPATFAQFYIDSSFPHSGGRLSVSKESDTYSNNGNGHQSRQNKPCKQDAEEVEAYRASFGFSADEIVTTAQYVEISDVVDDSFSMTPFTKPLEEDIMLNMSTAEGTKGGNISNMASPQHCKSRINHFEGADNFVKDHMSPKHSVDVFKQIEPANHAMSDDEGIFPKLGTLRLSRKYDLGLSTSDAEIDYRRGRSLRESKGNIAW